MGILRIIPQNRDIRQHTRRMFKRQQCLFLHVSSSLFGHSLACFIFSSMARAYVYQN